MPDSLLHSLTTGLTSGSFLGAGLTAGAGILSSSLQAGATERGLNQAANISSNELNAIVLQLNAERDEARRNRDFLGEQLASERLDRAVQLRFLFDFAEEQQARAEEIGTDLLGGVEDLLEPGSTEGFKLALEEGLQALRRSTARIGSPSSPQAQVGQGRFVAGLTAADQDRTRLLNESIRARNLARESGAANIRLGREAAQIGAQAFQQLPSAGVTGGLTSAVPPFSQQSNIALQQGANQAGLFGNIGQSVANIPVSIAFTDFLRRRTT